MITASETLMNKIISPVRDIQAGVELYEGSTLIENCKCDGRLIKFTVERIGDTSKFFGHGVCQKINVHLIDKDRTLNISTAYSIRVAYKVGDEVVYPYPTFYVTEVHRNENTNELSVTAYDLLYKAVDYTIPDMNLPKAYSYLYFASAASATLNTSGLKFANTDFTVFQTELPQGGNFEGTETVREGLDDLAEVTQCIYYIDNDNWLVFKRLDKDGNAALPIDKSQYITLSSKTNRRLGTIAHVTELGDNIEVSHTTGTTQYVRDNAFWTMMQPTDIAAALEKAKEAACGLSINQFDCNWRGNILLEIGDKIALTAKDNSIVYSYVLDDTIEYAGYLTEDTKWQYSGDDSETDAAPSTLGEALNKTYAKVDKVNKEIELLASKFEESDVGQLTEEVASLKLTTDSITAQVSKTQSDLENLEQSVSATLDPEKLAIMVNSKVDSVTTSTGFTFDATGLTVGSAQAATTTNINPNGLVILGMNDEELLNINNLNISTLNLNVRRFLRIGETSRLQDYENADGQLRTGCFWMN